MNKPHLTVKHMAQCSICAALLAISAWISIPMPQVSFTLQSFAVFFTLGLLGGRRGCVSIGIYLLMGAVGLPVFSGFRGGAGVLLGVTGGYIWGFLGAGLVYWLFVSIFGEKLYARMTAMVLGMLVCYGCGTAWYLYLYGGNFWAVLATCVVPYLIPDGIKIVLSITLANRLKRIVQ